MTVDLTNAEPGKWGARFLSESKPVVEVAELFDVLPFVVYAFKDPWIPVPARTNLDLAHAGWRPSYSLELVHAGSGTRAPLDFREGSDADTLRLSADLHGMPDGLYDLEVTGLDAGPMRVPSVLHLGRL